MSSHFQIHTESFQFFPLVFELTSRLNFLDGWIAANITSCLFSDEDKPQAIAHAIRLLNRRIRLELPREKDEAAARLGEDLNKFFEKSQEPLLHDAMRGLLAMNFEQARDCLLERLRELPGAPGLTDDDFARDAAEKWPPEYAAACHMPFPYGSAIIDIIRAHEAEDPASALGSLREALALARYMMMSERDQELSRRSQRKINSLVVRLRDEGHPLMGKALRLLRNRLFQDAAKVLERQISEISGCPMPPDEPSELADWRLC